MKKQKVSSAVIRRLPRYYRNLAELAQSGIVRISSSALGKAMNLTASQIRQDLSCFGEFGQQGYGYNVCSLKEEISEILGIGQEHTAIILGAGNLGRALMKNFRFDQAGFSLTAAFDVDEAVIGTEISGISIHPVDHLESFLEKEPVSVGVLTVPQSAAVSISKRLVASGVRGIWNFTNTDLNIESQDVIVENVHFADSLLTLSYLLSEEPV